MRKTIKIGVGGGGVLVAAILLVFATCQYTTTMRSGRGGGEQKIADELKSEYDKKIQDLQKENDELRKQYIKNIPRQSTEIGWINSLKSLKINADVCFIGDSITCNGRFEDYFSDKTVCNLGRGGDLILGITERLNMVEAVNAKQIFIMGGINNLLAGGSADSIYGNYEVLLKQIIEKFPNSEIYVQSILPINQSICKNTTNDIVKQSNKKIQELCEQMNITYIDLYSLYVSDDDNLSNLISKDGIHIMEESYETWYMQIEKYIK